MTNSSKTRPQVRLTLLTENKKDPNLVHANEDHFAKGDVCHFRFFEYEQSLYVYLFYKQTLDAFWMLYILCRYRKMYTNFWNSFCFDNIPKNFTF